MKNLFKYAAALALVLTGAGCDYNEDNFEGLQEGTVTTDIITLEMTLTDADYKAIATNSTNKALAGDDVSALSALQNTKYFTPTITAAKYVPAYLASLYPTVDPSSSIKVTSNYNAGEVPAELSALRAAETYEVTSDEYKAAWGEVEAKYFTPGTHSILMPTIFSRRLMLRLKLAM